MQSPKPDAPHLARGQCGEEIAARALNSAGYHILARNWRFGHCEIDIICEQAGEIVFVEVKTRRSHKKGGGPGAITAKKRQNLARAAQKWLLVNKAWLAPCRFDVICLYGSGETFSLEHFKNAFCPTLDRSNANWQSW